jgi:hypothetical protein
MMMMTIIVTVNNIRTVQNQFMVANHGKNMTEEMMVNIVTKNEIMKKDIDNIENMIKKQ